MLRDPAFDVVGGPAADGVGVASTRREDSSLDWPVAPVQATHAPVERQPTRVGRYRLLVPIGEGAMGTVYRAIDADLEREVAVKLVRGRSTEAARARLLREARALARFSHANIISVFDVGIEDGLMYVVMEYRPGRTLNEWLAEEPRDWRAVLDVFVQAGQGLMALHAVGLGHHDFKPHNVLLGEDGIPRVLDFGLAKAFTQCATSDSVARPAVPGTAPQITAEGTVLGTPAYMSPEHWCKTTTDARSDQFSFCVALYEGLYGRRPFDGRNARQLAHNIVRGRLLAPPLTSGVPPRLWEILAQGMASVPADRHASMHALLRELRRVQLREQLRAEAEAMRKERVGAPDVVSIEVQREKLASGSHAREHEVRARGAVAPSMLPAT